MKKFYDYIEEIQNTNGLNEFEAFVKNNKNKIIETINSYRSASKIPEFKSNMKNAKNKALKEGVSRDQMNELIKKYVSDKSPYLIDEWY